jgi:hypothetical protein
MASSGRIWKEGVMPDKGTILASVWRNCGKPLKTSSRTVSVLIKI